MTRFKALRRVVQVASEREAGLKALELQSAVQRFCPVDTGRLRQSITATQIAPGHWRVGTNVNYALHVEYGTLYQRAQPFFRPALKQVFGGP